MTHPPEDRAGSSTDWLNARLRRAAPSAIGLVLLLVISGLTSGSAALVAPRAAVAPASTVAHGSTHAPDLSGLAGSSTHVASALFGRTVGVGAVHSPLRTHVVHGAAHPLVVCAGCGYYMQEAAIVDQLCVIGASTPCTGVPGLSALSFDVTIRRTPYETGFEVTAMTNQGDWFKSAVLFNWCGPGFDIGNEAFNRTAVSVYPTTGTMGCFGGPAMGAGDVINLGMYVSDTGSSTGDVCFTANDTSTPGAPNATYARCIPQPDPGATPSTNYFVPGSGTYFFTGPMTEIINRTTTGCLDYRSMPDISYQMVAGAYVLHATPFSLQGNPILSQTCYVAVATTPWSFNPDNSTYFVADGSGHSGRYGPHWLGARNISSLSNRSTWQFDTDAVLPAPTQTLYSMDVGQYPSVSFADPVAGANINGVRWIVNWSYSPLIGNCSEGASNQTLVCTTGPAYASSITLVVYEVGGYTDFSPVASFLVYADPTIKTVTATPKVLDANQSTTLTATVAGGSGGVTYAWSDLPPGCAPADRSSITCSPTVGGTYNATVHINDSFGYSANGATGPVHVYSDPNVTIAAPGPAERYIDLSQSFSITADVLGGSGGNVYNWTGGPPGCTGATTATYTCTGQYPGPITVNLGVTDSNRFTTRIHPLTVLVYARLTASPAAPTFQATVGTSVNIAVNVSGGDPPYTSSWTGLPNGCFSANRTTLVCTPTSAGTYTVTFSVKDALGGTSNATVTLTLTSASGAAGLSNTDLLVLGVILAVVVVAVGVGLALRRRPAPRPPVGDEEAEPESTEETAPDAP
ncbi:MAG TPA: hypothetical protein VGV89_04495 [Thermoplasmata archaeon]|nr:hypothetical protein [Thermoplasmata archaeon]